MVFAEDTNRNRRPRMAESIAGAVARLKRAADPLRALGRGAVEAVCEELGHAWRDRTLDPATTLALFVQQVLHGNCPCSEVRHLAAGGPSFTPGAYCQARSRLPLAVYRSLLTRVVDAALPHTREAGHRWRGRRVFHVDGTTFSMPDTPRLQEAFGQPAAQAPGCGFPAAHLLVLFSASTGLLLDAAAGPLYTGDIGVAAGMHPHLGRGDVLVGDDAFGTYAHLALLLRDGLHGLFPVHHSRIVDFTPGRAHCPEGKRAVEGMPRSRWVGSLGRDDQLVEWFKPKTRPLWTPIRRDPLPSVTGTTRWRSPRPSATRWSPARHCRSSTRMSPTSTFAPAAARWPTPSRSSCRRLGASATSCALSARCAIATTTSSSIRRRPSA
jgi:hypothetical protein